MRKNFYYIVLIIVVLIIVTTTLFVRFTHTTSVVLLASLGWISFLVKHLYTKWEWFYLKVQKIVFILTNPDSMLNMTVRYSVIDFNEKKMQLLKKYLIENSRLKNVKMLNISGGGLELRSDGLIVQLFNDVDEIELFVLDMPVTYNKAISVTETILLPLFEDIENIVHATKKTYFMKVNFDKINPYYGLYLSKIPKQAIVSFDIKFIVDRNDIEITKDSVVLRSDNKTELASLAREYLTLTPKHL